METTFIIGLLLIVIVAVLIDKYDITYRKINRRGQGTSYILDWPTKKWAIIWRTFDKGKGGGYRLSLYHGHTGYHFFHKRLSMSYAQSNIAQ